MRKYDECLNAAESQGILKIKLQSVFYFVVVLTRTVK